MIHYSEIIKTASNYGVLNDTIEKDYIITWILIGMANEGFAKDIVFYGGTTLKKVYFPDYRFSEDIDLLTKKEIDFDNFLQRFENVNAAIRQMANVSLITDSKSVDISGARLQFFLKFDAFSEFSRGGQVKMDLMRNVELIEKPKTRRVILTYSDMKDISIELPAYSLEALLAEKIGAVADRTEPRDLYDVWFLLKQGSIKIAKIKQYLKKKYGYEFERGNIVPQISKISYNRLWKERLKNQVSHLPEIDTVRDEITHYIKQYFE